MALRLAGEPNGVQEEIECIAYENLLKDSGDLETGTKTITATSKQATPDYTWSPTLPAAPDGLSVLRAVVRSLFTIDSMTAGTLNISIEVNGIERISDTATAPGDKISAVDLSSGQFNLGSATQIDVYLWVDSGDAVISVCNLWLTPGTCNASTPQEIMRATKSGLITFLAQARRVGTGTPYARLRLYSSSCNIEAADLLQANGHATWLVEPLFLSQEGFSYWIYGTVATDANYTFNLHFIRRILV
ncbi:MAG TPA: hypothetical protein G4O03_03665 [Dehalococcoidia bacterium]|nr:hypothetical protein [Dehalococcoidia bacterium]